jgi:hypothetical protein
VYEAQRLQAKHRFELFTDVIRVHGSALEGDFDSTIPLVQLDPTYARFRVYSGSFYVGIWIFLLGIMALLVVVMVTLLQEAKGFPVKPMSLAGGLAAFGLALILVNSRKVELAQFRSEAGVSMLVISRVAKGAGDFDEFLPLLVNQIHLARAGAHVGGSDISSSPIDA